jgi:hypothetical protein
MIYSTYVEIFKLSFEWVGDASLYIGKETFSPSGFGFAIWKGSPLKQHLDKW